MVCLKFWKKKSKQGSYLHREERALANKLVKVTMIGEGDMAIDIN